MLHCTQLPFDESLAVSQNEPVAHSESRVHDRQVFVDASQTGVAPLQSAFAKQPTHQFFESSQTGVAPVHLFEKFEVQSTQRPALGPEVAHAGVAPPHATPESYLLHGRHAGGESEPSQIGMVATHALA